MERRTLSYIDALFDILAQARALAPEQREAFLRAQLPEGSDRELLLSLLQSEGTSSHIAGLLGQAWQADAETLPAGTLLGNFRIEQWLGSGGQGQVYLARLADAVVDKPFALKLPHRLSGASIAALRQEARAVAKLEHPGIARFLYLDKTAAGQWFLVTEYVAGQRLDQALHGQDRRALLQTFAHLCDALAHAHSQGVAHLDLKPSNVLVESGGQPRILDFGLGLIQAAQEEEKIHGYTLPYAADEQVAGDPSMRSDIYALGVMLLQAASASQGAQLDTRLAQLAAADPALRRELGVDLHAILRRACARDAAQRYAAIAQFGADLRAVLASAPVSARDWSWRYALGCLLRRRPWASAAVVGSIVLLLAALLALTVQRASLQRAEAQARADAERARSSLQLLVSAMESGDPESAPQVTQAEQALVERLKRAAARSSDAAIRASIDLVVARIARSTGDQRSALALIDDVVARTTQLGAGVLLAQALIAKGEAHTELGDYAAAAAAFERVRALPPEQVDQAALLRGEGRRLLRLPQLDEAERTLRAAIAAAGDDEHLRIGAGNDLGTILLDRSRVAEATALFEQQQPLVESTYGAASVAAGVNAHNRAVAYFLGARQDAALQAVREAQRLYTAQLGADSVRNADALALEAMILLADDVPRSRQCLEQAAATYRRVYGPGHAKVAQTLYTLGQLHLESGDAKAALQIFDQALTLLGNQADTHPFLISLRLGKGSALVALDDARQALPLLEAALAGMTALSPQPDLNKAQIYNALSAAHRRLGQAQASAEASRSAYAMADASLPADALDRVAYSLERAASLALAGDAEQARPLLAQARTSLEAQAGRPAAQRLRPHLAETEAYVKAHAKKT